MYSKLKCKLNLNLKMQMFNFLCERFIFKFYVVELIYVSSTYINIIQIYFPLYIDYSQLILT